MKHKPIRTTIGQRERLYPCGPGVGFIAYNQGPNIVMESEFFIDREGQIRHLKGRTPLTLEILNADKGIRVVEIHSKFAGEEGGDT